MPLSETPHFTDLRPFGYQTSYLAKPIYLTALRDEALLWHRDCTTEPRQRVSLAPALSRTNSSLASPARKPLAGPQPRAQASPGPRPPNNLTCPMNPLYPPHPHSLNRIPISDSLSSCLEHLHNPTNHSWGPKSSPIFSSNTSPFFQFP